MRVDVTLHFTADVGSREELDRIRKIIRSGPGIAYQYLSRSFAFEDHSVNIYHNDDCDDICNCGIWEKSDFGIL